MKIAEIFQEIFSKITAGDLVFLAIGLLPFAYWLANTDFGKKSLDKSSIRRNNMPLWAPLVPLFVWFGASAILSVSLLDIFDGIAKWQEALFRNIIWIFCGAVAIVIIIFQAKRYFARGLRGLGLKLEKAGEDLKWGFVNLIAIWPLVFIAIIGTLFFGKLLFGVEFELPQHGELELMRTYGRLPVLIAIGFIAIVIAPIMEEFLFRGLVQSLIRSITGRVWVSIFFTSGLFAVMHADAGHWPALFVLATCLGYSYEKSGSILRPIFIHAIFNSLSVVTVAVETLGK